MLGFGPGRRDSSTKRQLPVDEEQDQDLAEARRRVDALDIRVDVLTRRRTGWDTKPR